MAKPIEGNEPGVNDVPAAPEDEKSGSKPKPKPKPKPEAEPKDDDGPNRERKAKRLARQYGFVLAFFETDPDLKALFDKAVRKTWSTQRFIAELRDTKWFKTHSVTLRNAILQETADPATYNAEVRKLAATIRDTWGATFGGTLGVLDDGELKLWAETAYRMGWTEAQVMDHMTKSINFQKLMTNKRLGGSAAELKNTFEALGRAYGLNPGNRWVASQVEKVISGRDTQEGVATRLKEWAKREYAAFAAELDGGATIEDIAEPYVSKMAEMLELNPAGIHARQGLVQKALRARGQDGNPRPLSLGDFEDMLRRDPRWQKTNNARETVMEITHNLLRNFGLVN